jgi:hypothetical protein
MASKQVIKMSNYLAREAECASKATQHTNYKSIAIQEGDMKRIEEQGGVASMRDVKLIQAVESQSKYEKGSKGKGKEKSDRCYIKAGGNYETVMLSQDSARRFGDYLSSKGIQIPRQSGDSDSYKKEFLAEFIDEMYYEVFQEFMKGYYFERCFTSNIEGEIKYGYDFDKISVLNDEEALNRIEQRMSSNIEARGIQAGGASARNSQKAKYEAQLKEIEAERAKEKAEAEAQKAELEEMRKQFELMKAKMKAQSGKLRINDKKKSKPAPKADE